MAAKFLLKLALPVLVLAGCTFLMGPDEPVGENTGTGTLTVSFGEAGGDRAVSSGKDLPAEVLAALRYEVSFTGPGGAVINRTVSGSETVSLSLTGGSWRIDASAYYGEALAGTGSLSFELRTGNTSVRVPMYMSGPLYEITIPPMAAGTVASNFNFAFPGTAIILTAVPAEGYRLLSMSAGGPLSLEGSGNSRSFTMPAADVTVSAEFEALAQLSGTVTISPDSGVTTGTLLTAAYSGGETVAWQWNRDGDPLSGQTAQTCTPMAAGSYTVTASAAGFQSKTSAAVAVTHGANIKNNFSISAAGTQGVTDTFNAVSAYLRSKSAAEVAGGGIIQLGDYIDLPSITVGISTVTDQELAGHGRLLRLIVVGINSFNEGQGGGYNVSSGNGTDAHLVFQFQNLPFTRNMNTSMTNMGGYAASAMRTWLTGNFLPGLEAAGVPDAVLWAPARYVANGGNSATAASVLSDKLWLPTERELFGAQTNSHAAWETAANQARLAYYEDAGKRIKYNSHNTALAYWEASPYFDSAFYFCYVLNSGAAGNYLAGNDSGVAPAFCVK